MTIVRGLSLDKSLENTPEALYKLLLAVYFWSAWNHVPLAVHLNLLFRLPFPSRTYCEGISLGMDEKCCDVSKYFCRSIDYWLRCCVDSHCLFSGVVLHVAIAVWLKPGRDTKQDRWFPTDFPSSSFIFHLTINSSVWMDTFTHGTKMNNNEIFNNSLHLHSL